MGDQMRKLRALADAWRKRHPVYEGGIVLIWDGEVYGWKNILRDASSERPGVFAVDAFGLVYVSAGGDYQNGARCWVALPPDADSCLEG